MTRTEAQTRAELIDNQLAQSGWNVKDPTQVIEEFDILTPLPLGVAEPRTPYEGHQFSDYVLLGKDRKPLAVVEAKKTSKDAALGREQAKQYCYNIQKQLGGELPFCFYTNGLEIYFWDLDNYPPHKIVGFPTRDDLERFQYIRRYRKPLTQELINTSIAGRDYQIRAIRAVLEGIEQKKRDFLLVMAAGTGKTRTCIAMVDALMRAGHAEKVLFLVDRIALREQASNSPSVRLPSMRRSRPGKRCTASMNVTRRNAATVTPWTGWSSFAFCAMPTASHRTPPFPPFSNRPQKRRLPTATS